MSNQEEIMEKNKEEQDDDVYDEVPSKEAMNSQRNTDRTDIHAWRKRQSIAFLRNPLRLRRMSRGEQFVLLFVFVLLEVLFFVCIVI
jgi:hypothetical protein